MLQVDEAHPHAFVVVEGQIRRRVIQFTNAFVVYKFTFLVEFHLFKRTRIHLFAQQSNVEHLRT